MIKCIVSCFPVIPLCSIGESRDQMRHLCPRAPPLPCLKLRIVHIRTPVDSQQTETFPLIERLGDTRGTEF